MHLKEIVELTEARTERVLGKPLAEGDPVMVIDAIRERLGDLNGIVSVVKLAGALGTRLNEEEKQRARDCITTAEDVQSFMVFEIFDKLIRLSAALGVDFEKAVVTGFNEVGQVHDLDERLTESP